jgi:hypothetical protein
MDLRFLKKDSRGAGAGGWAGIGGAGGDGIWCVPSAGGPDAARHILGDVCNGRGRSRVQSRVHDESPAERHAEPVDAGRGIDHRWAHSVAADDVRRHGGCRGVGEYRPGGAASVRRFAGYADWLRRHLHDHRWQRVPGGNVHGYASLRPSELSTRIRTALSGLKAGLEATA